MIPGLFLGPASENQAELVTRHVDHMVQLVGPRHVGLGLDYVFDTAELEAYLEKMRATFPAHLGYDAAISMVAPEQLVDVVTCLVRRGYGRHDLEAILGLGIDPREQHQRLKPQISAPLPQVLRD